MKYFFAFLGTAWALIFILIALISFSEGNASAGVGYLILSALGMLAMLPYLFSDRQGSPQLAPSGRNYILSELSSAYTNANDKLLSIMVARNQEGIALEKAGKIEQAIELYEKNIEDEFEGSHPYNRLAIIYSKQKKYADEIRILNVAINVFTNNVSPLRGDRGAKLEQFRLRLEKANAKLEKIASNEKREQLSKQEQPNKVIVSVDMSSLDKIRRDSQVTQESLVVEDGLDTKPHSVPSIVCSTIRPCSEIDSSLNGWELFIHTLEKLEIDILHIVLQCGDSRAFAVKNGILLELLVDAINEKSFNALSDNILVFDEKVELYPDYINELREQLMSLK